MNAAPLSGGIALFFKNLSEKKWYNGAVVVCIGVAFYVLLTNFGTVLSMLGKFIGYFKPVILGGVIAYIISPLAKAFYYRLLKKMKAGKMRWYVSVLLACITTLIVVLLLMGMLIPQLLESAMLFSSNIDLYSTSLINLLNNSPFSSIIGQGSMETISANAMASISVFVKDNTGDILNIAANSGKGILTTVIAMILAVYLLIDSRRISTASQRLMKAILPSSLYELYLDFTLRLDTILVNYLVQSLLDSLIVGVVCAIFMLICRMPYVGLISVVVGITNLIPNFGPVIGGVIGAFILLLVNPMYALIFIVFCLFLQLVDGYILKPKLFSDSLGVSGLVILISTIVLGNMFGIPGILLSIPAAAVLSFIVNDYFLPWKERRKSSHKTQ